MPRSSRSFLFPDVNVWVALTYQGHEHHDVARQWFETLDADDRVCFCRFTQISLLRLLTTAAVLGGEVMTQAEAWSAYDLWKQDERVVFLDEPPNVESTFRALSRRSLPSSRNWADAYLAAFAEVSSMRLVTFDRGFHGRIENIIILNS